MAQDERPSGVDVGNHAAVLLLARVSVRDGSSDFARHGRGKQLGGRVHQRGALAIAGEDELGARAVRGGLGDEIAEVGRVVRVTALGAEVVQQIRGIVETLRGNDVGAQLSLQLVDGLRAGGAADVAVLIAPAGVKEDDVAAAALEELVRRRAGF